MGKNDKWLYLVSSNATKEYIMDILEALSMPFGSVQHFRYRLKWIDKELRNEIPLEGNSLTGKLKNRRVVICYLYQEKRDSEWEWIAAYPIRSGILMDAYKTGDSDGDVSHFYFKVDNYISYDKQGFTNDKQDFTKILRGIAGKKWNIAYAFLCVALDDTYIADKEDSKSAFHKICNSLSLEHLKSPEGKEYFPIYCFIDGLKNRKGKILEPKYDPIAHKSFYEIKEGNIIRLNSAHILHRRHINLM
jgi:hypothetical protein